MKRTYGRKNSRRSRPDIGDTPPPRKRPRIEVEIVPPKSSISPSPSVPISHLSPPTSATSPIQRNATLPDIGAMSGAPSSMRTPKKPAQSLDTLFPTSTHRMPSSPGISLGVVKRMLSRSRTDPSIDCNVSHNPCTPLSNTLPVDYSPQKRSPSSSPIPTQNEILPTKHARTYAGTSRSYLMAIPAVDSVESDDTRESYSDLRSRWGIDNSEDDPRSVDDIRRLKKSHSVGSLALSNEMPNELKSITELRSKGESRRFLDEVGYLFEGMETGCAIGLRRASVLEIISKLCDPDFNRRAKISDFYTRTWDIFIKARGEGLDKVLDATLSFFAFFSTHDPQTLSELGHKPDFVPTLLDILSSFTPIPDMTRDGLNQGLRKDVLALAFSGLNASGLKAAGIIRTDVAPLKSLADIIAKSGVVKDIRGVSVRTLLSMTLSSLPPSFLPPSLQTLPPVLNSLRTELRLIPPRISAWKRGLKLFPGSAETGTDGHSTISDKGKERQKSSVDIVTPSLAHIHACLRVLDTYLMDSSSGNSESREREKINRALVNGALLDDIVELCVATEILVWGGVRDLDAVAMNGGQEDGVKDVREERENELARKTLFSALRILTLLPASYSQPSPTYPNILWTPSNIALSLVTRVVLRAQAGWVGSFCGGSCKQPRENRRGRGERGLVSSSVPAYSLTCVESFDLLCLALGLLLNWTSEEGNAVSEKLRHVLLNPACCATRNCTYICACPSSSQMSLLSCLVSVYQSYCRTDSLWQEQNTLSVHACKSASDVDRNSISYSKPLSPHSMSNIRITQFQSPEIAFLTGYTAVLLGLIYTSTSPRDMRVPISAVESLTRGDVLLESLIIDARNFLELYENFEEELNDEDSIMHIDGEVCLDVSSDIEGLSSMGLGCRGGGKELEKRNKKVAYGVLEALEAL